MFSSRPILAVRRLTRRLGLNSLVGGLLARLGYENAFGRRMLSAIQIGDCVWDVGANVGIYTERFLDLVGDTGQVVAFEPSQECHAALVERIGPGRRVTVIQAALAAADGTATLYCAADPLAATHTISADAGAVYGSSGTAYDVTVHSGDSFVANQPNLHPNVIKIDVEGFEHDVLSGMTQLLRDSRLRAVFVEIHFSLLDAQGKSDAPAQIVEMLQGAGFDVAWPDPSHLAATRRRS